MSEFITFIAGDIGGTNSRLQLFQVDRHNNAAASSGHEEEKQMNAEKLIYEQTYPSQKYASLTFVIEKFLKEAAGSAAKKPEKKGNAAAGNSTESFHPVACCLAVAGPVRANCAVITNVNWILDGSEMSRSLGIKDFLIINDFVGIGYGLLALTRKDVIPINDVPLSDEAPKACLGAGTGLGEVYLTAGQFKTGDSSDENKRRMSDRTSTEENCDAEYNVWASEGGHADFAPRDSLEFGLLEFIKTQERVTRVSVERIVSGMGIPKIYEYFVSLHPEEVLEEVTTRLRTEDQGKVIAEYAENGKCNLCKQSIELFVKCYGAEAGNLAMKILPFGGLYIAGGIAPKLTKFMKKNNLFYQHFVQKGRMQNLLEKIPVFIVTHEQVGLLGAQVVCRRLLRRKGFLPGRGDLAAFTEATPRADSMSDVFSFPALMDEAAQKNFETEVTIDPNTKQPERVIVRRRRNSSSVENKGPGGRSRAGSVSYPASSSGPRGFTRRDALTFGMIGGTIASLISVGTLVAFNYFQSQRKNYYASK